MDQRKNKESRLEPINRSGQIMHRPTLLLSRCHFSESQHRRGQSRPGDDCLRFAGGFYQCSEEPGISRQSSVGRYERNPRALDPRVQNASKNPLDRPCLSGMIKTYKIVRSSFGRNHLVCAPDEDARARTKELLACLHPRQVSRDGCPCFNEMKLNEKHA